MTQAVRLRGPAPELGARPSRRAPQPLPCPGEAFFSSTGRHSVQRSEVPAGRRRGLVGGLDPGPGEARAGPLLGRVGPRRRVAPAPRYFRTRLEAEGFIFGLLVGEPGAALVGFDFAFGYPADAGLPAGRALCAKLDRLVRDEPDGANNRFEVAGTPEPRDPGRVRRRLRGSVLGPPGGPRVSAPPARRVRARSRRASATAGSSSDGSRHGASRARGSSSRAASVGSQTLVGLPAVHRLLTEPALGIARAALAVRDRVGRGGRMATAS